MNDSAMSGTCRTVPQSLREYARGLAGGLLFSLPLLYTMEVWWAGFIARPWHLFAYVLVTFIILLGYNRYAGLRRDAGFAEVAVDSVEEMGIGLLLATFILLLLGRITFGMSASEVMGKIVVEAMTVAIGVSVGTAQLGGEDEGQDEVGMEEEDDNEPQGIVSEMVMAFCGAVLIASNVGPTEEIVVIGAEATSWHLLSISLVSIILGAGILFFINFAGSQSKVGRDSIVAIISGIVMTYAVALVASALILLFFNRFEGAAPVVALGYIVVLGLPATLGASAGRLLLQGGDSNRQDRGEQNSNKTVANG